MLRFLVEIRLKEWGLFHVRQGDLADACALVTAELASNAVKATPGDDIRFRFARENAGLYLGVWDAGDRLPVRTPFREPSLEALDRDPAGFDGYGGNGLPLVEALTYECGTVPTPPRGKWVFGRIGI
jgi:anti-sigma regulatory factor (Ser/Thr protein kinase)